MLNQSYQHNQAPSGRRCPDRKVLVVITGATASGKTALAIEVARRFGSDIISADSRQIYRGIPICTAVPTPGERAAVRHHFIEILDLDDYYSAACFESDVMKLLPELWEKSPVQVMCGGSMMYIDAVTKGLDQLPTISPEIREYAARLLATSGCDAVIDRLRDLDPGYLKTADIANPRRLVHALEICLEAGVPYSSLRTGTVSKRDFHIIKVAVDHPREVLFDRINRRVDAMIDAGLEREARNVYHMRHLNSLNTVGFKEMFAMFDGTMDRETAIARMAKNTRVYAKKQLTWLKRAGDTLMLSPDKAFDTICQLINKSLNI